MNDNTNLKLEEALKYASQGWHVFPCHNIKEGKCSCGSKSCDKPGKHPRTLHGSKDATIDQAVIRRWWKDWPDANIGCATGESSGFVVLDLDTKHGKSVPEMMKGLLEKGYNIPATICSRTGQYSDRKERGSHFFFKHPGVPVKNATDFLKNYGIRGVDCRADGGYVILPPSNHITGVAYEWQEEPEGIGKVENLAEMPEWFLKLVAEDRKEKKWLAGKDGVSKGSRNDTAASMAGKIISSTPPELLESLGWDQFKVWNNKNSPPISERELRDVWESISKYEPGNDMDGGEKKNQAEQLLKIVAEKENVILFHDDKDEAYISLKIGDHNEIMALKSKVVRRWLTKEFWNAHEKAINPESVKNAIAVLEGRACFEGPMYKLQNRMAWNNGELWYDLSNGKWQAVKINDKSWGVVGEPPILFNRYPHNQPQVMPAAKNGNVKLILNYINISDPEQQLLLLVYLISCFIPDFPHAILVIFGPQGSAKSTLSKLLRRIVDPSFIEVASLPDSLRELVQALAHHAFLFFDNVSFVGEEVSDILCKATTGSGFVKRQLYFDDEDIIYNFKRSIGINGINLVATRPDLLDRSILLELEMIDESKRKQERELMDSFEKDLPLILGGVFDVIADTIKIKPTIKLLTSPRMADFALWGSAIAEALGYTKEDFLNAYQNNINKQTETILNENMVALALISFMEERSWQRWEGTMSELLHKLTAYANFEDMNIKDKYWPKAPNVLSRTLNILKITLRSADISIATSGGKKRKVVIEKISLAKTDPVLPPTTTSLLPEDNTDSIDDKNPTLTEPGPSEEMPF
jgi:hypothetical protein